MKKLLLTAFAVSVVASNAMAGENYVGVSVGKAIYPTDKAEAHAQYIANYEGTTHLVQNRTASAYKIFGGSWINDNFGAEIGYANLGEVKATFTAPTGTEIVKQSHQALYLSALAGYNFETIKSKVYAKLGFYYGMSKSSDYINIPGWVPGETGSTNNSGMMYGIGYSYPISNKIDLKAEYEEFKNVGNEPKTAKADIALVTLGLNYKF